MSEAILIGVVVFFVALGLYRIRATRPPKIGGNWQKWEWPNQ